MEKKEEILENFKTAISSTVRSISDKENIEVIFKSFYFKQYWIGIIFISN